MIQDYITDEILGQLPNDKPLKKYLIQYTNPAGLISTGFIQRVREKEVDNLRALEVEILNEDLKTTHLMRKIAFVLDETWPVAWDTLHCSVDVSKI